MGWTPAEEQSKWISLTGASALVCYFAPAAFIAWHRYGSQQAAPSTAVFLLTIAMLLLVFLSFAVALSSKSRLNRPSATAL